MDRPCAFRSECFIGGGAYARKTLGSGAKPRSLILRCRSSFNKILRRACRHRRARELFHRSNTSVKS